MDKGFSSSRDPRNRRPKTISNNGPGPNEESPRDPRLHHDKYREKIMSKNRISPDTTVSVFCCFTMWKFRKFTLTFFFAKIK